MWEKIYTQLRVLQQTDLETLLEGLDISKTAWTESCPAKKKQKLMLRAIEDLVDEVGEENEVQFFKTFIPPS